MSRLGVTRASEQLEFLTAKARKQGIEVVALPIVIFRNLPFEWPPKMGGDRIDWIVFTSAQGVHSFFSQLGQEYLTLIKNANFAVVADKTAAALNQYGLRADFVASEPYGESLFCELIDNRYKDGESVVYIGAKVTNYDPEKLMVARKVDYKKIESYQPEDKDLSGDLISSFCSDDCILFTAPSTVSAFHKQFSKPITRVIAIGKSTARQMQEYDWSVGTIMAKPDVDAILEYL